MKKLVLFAVAAIAISFSSCTNKANQEGDATTDTTAVAVEQVVEEVAPAADSNAVEVVEEAAVEVAPAK